MNLSGDDEQAFRRQLVALLPRLRRFALSLCRDQAEADDLVQAACERALRRWRRWRPGSRLDNWMFAIIRHLFIDETRTARRKNPHVPLEEERLLTTVANTMKKIEAKMNLEQVAGAMQRLAAGERLVIALVCVEGMSYKDAAATMQVPVGTVMSRLARGRKKLHRLVRSETDLEKNNEPE